MIDELFNLRIDPSLARDEMLVVCPLSADSHVQNFEELIEKLIKEKRVTLIRGLSSE